MFLYRFISNFKDLVSVLSLAYSECLPFAVNKSGSGAYFPIKSIKANKHKIIRYIRNGSFFSSTQPVVIEYPITNSKLLFHFKILLFSLEF